MPTCFLCVVAKRIIMDMYALSLTAYMAPEKI